MGIPSPLVAPCASPLLKLKQGQLSPELPLQTVEELGGQDICEELLPPPTVELKAPRTVSLKPTLAQVPKRRAWADAKESDASDSGDEEDSGDTSLPRDSESLESESQSNSSVPKPSNLTEEDLQAKGVMKMNASGLDCSLLQLLCRIWRDGSQGMSIVPCTGDDLAADCEHEAFWCWVQQQEDGSMIITPCTDASACGVLADASGMLLDSTTDVVGAPARPPTGSHVPAWVYGAQWPYCVAPTTVILSNLPEDLIQEDLIEILDKEDFSGFYDFLYLPSEPDCDRNSGYAIVNLTRHEYGLALSALLQGRTSWCGTTTSECQVTWSIPLQGVVELIKHYRNHPANHDNVPEDRRPTFFASGWPSPFPAEKS